MPRRPEISFVVSSCNWFFRIPNPAKKKSESDDLIKFVKSNKNVKYIFQNTVIDGTQIFFGSLFFSKPMTSEIMKRVCPAAEWKTSPFKNIENVQVGQVTWSTSQNNQFQTNFDVGGRKEISPSSISKKSVLDSLNHIILREYENVEWKAWQQDLINTVKTEPDRKIIHWYFDSTGGTGKKFVTLYLGVTNNTVVSSLDDKIVYQKIKNSVEKGIIPKVLILNILEDKPIIDYNLLSFIKSGMLTVKSTGETLYLPPLHVVVFSKVVPDPNCFSSKSVKLRLISPEQNCHRQEKQKVCE